MIINFFKSKWQALKYSVLSGICEPVGALVFGVFFSNLLTPYIVQCLLAGGMPITLLFVQPTFHVIYLPHISLF